jgi:hypothetical protein
MYYHNKLLLPEYRVIGGLSRMRGNFHVRFLEEGKGAISSSYSAITRMHTDTIDPFFVFDQKGKIKCFVAN